MTRTESELASVLGHEMGHVLQRHIARMIGASEKTGYAALATMLLGVLAGILARSGDLGSAIALGGQAYAIDNQLRFSRGAEREADRVGFQLLAGAGFDPYGMPGFFERLERASMGDAGVPAYARTHPLTGERIADMDDRARRAPYRQPRQSAEYAFVRVRLRILQNRSPTDIANEVRRLRIEVDERTAASPAANGYGVALGEMLAGRYDAAGQALDAARADFERTRQEEEERVRSTPSLDVLEVSGTPTPATARMLPTIGSSMALLAGENNYQVLASKRLVLQPGVEYRMQDPVGSDLICTAGVGTVGTHVAAAPRALKPGDLGNWCFIIPAETARDVVIRNTGDCEMVRFARSVRTTRPCRFCRGRIAVSSSPSRSGE